MSPWRRRGSVYAGTMDSGGGRRTTRRQALGAIAGVGAAVVAGDALRSISALPPGPIVDGVDPTPASATRVDPPDPPNPEPRQGWVTESIGTTVRGRSIPILHSRAFVERVWVVVIGAIHGNEPVTRPIVEALRGAEIPDDMTLSLVPTANPDGWAAGTRRNATGVDLNRNFPWRWSPSDGGPHPASAPETQALMALVRTRPDLVVWVHQPLAYVAPLAGCPYSYADAWARVVGLRRRVGLDQHGGSETWTAKGAGVRSILVEVSSWNSTPSMVDAHLRGFEAMAPIVQPV